MYANHNDLPAFLDQITRKESLCVSRNLGATILADNCSTAHSTQSRMLKMIIYISRTKGITDKKLLVHHVGHCQNHIRNGWCNEVQLDLESVPVTHWRIVCHALRRISESVVSWVTYIGELHAFLWSYNIPSLYVTHSSSIIFLSKHIG